jgi:hypothetical protein
LVLSVLKGETSIPEAARKHGLRVAGRAGVLINIRSNDPDVEAPRTRSIGTSLLVRGRLLLNRFSPPPTAASVDAATGARRRSSVAEEKQLAFLESDADVDLGTALTADVHRPAARLPTSNRIIHPNIAAIAMPAAALSSQLDTDRGNDIKLEHNKSSLVLAR